MKGRCEWKPSEDIPELPSEVEVVVLSQSNDGCLLIFRGAGRSERWEREVGISKESSKSSSMGVGGGMGVCDAVIVAEEDEVEGTGRVGRTIFETLMVEALPGSSSSSSLSLVIDCSGAAFHLVGSESRACVRGESDERLKSLAQSS